ncbi:MAG TPA: asparagine synthase-related protein, partial [Burkholderiales bacterium]|nr:asparagine synthase-related protein [Burkholderiales bacterium]
TLLDEGGVGETWREIGEYVAVHGGQHCGIFLSQIRHHLQSKLHAIKSYRRLAFWRHCRRARGDDWFGSGLTELVPGRRFKGGYGANLRESLSRSTKIDPLPLYLRLEDRNSMAHSVEARVPFMDYRLASFSYGLPANWNMRGPWNKFMLREAMRNRIPESVRTRPTKFGFPVPVSKWLSGPLYDAFREQVTSRRARERGIYNMDNILRDLERHRRGEHNIDAKLFRVVQLEKWLDLQEPSAGLRGVATR